jgi:hypothetical protein
MDNVHARYQCEIDPVKEAAAEIDHSIAAPPSMIRTGTTAREG